MSDSAEGWMAPATRQNPGRSAIGLPPGGMNSPADLDSAMFILMFGSDKVARLSQLAASPTEAAVAVMRIAKGTDFIDYSCSFEMVSHCGSVCHGSFPIEIS
jgi:hypothetical protein